MIRQCLAQIVLVGVLAAGSAVLCGNAYADDTAQLKEQVQQLQDRVDQLESQIANKQQNSTITAYPWAGGLPANGYYDQEDDPFVQMMQMRQQLDRSMRNAFVDTGGVFSPKMDLKKTDRQYIITMDIPGMDKDKIDIEVKDRMLIISGERQSESQDNKYNQYYRKERSFGTFMQAVPLPEDARSDQIEAKYRNGVLVVSVVREKKEDKNSHSSKIAVN